MNTVAFRVLLDGRERYGDRGFYVPRLSRITRLYAPLPLVPRTPPYGGHSCEVGFGRHPVAVLIRVRRCAALPEIQSLLKVPQA